MTEGKITIGELVDLIEDRIEQIRENEGMFTTKEEELQRLLRAIR